MANRRLPLILVLTLGAFACGGGESGEPASDTGNTAFELPEDQRIRTADPYARGYTDADFPRIQELASGVYSYEQLRSAGEEKFTTVSLFIVTDAGVLVADGQGNVDETQRMIDHIAESTDQTITHVVVASDQRDHTSGHSAVPDDARFWAHPTSAAALERMAENNADLPLATDLVSDREVLQMGGREIHVQFLGRAHTGGDLVVYLPSEKIMFMSEAYLHRVFPAMRSAYPSEWVEMIEAAQAMDVDTYVPGHGFVDHPSVLQEELEVFQGAIRAVIAEAHRWHEEGFDLQDAIAGATFGDLETWSLRESQGDRALQQVFAEIEGTLPGGNP
ncbi:MAG: MBL fold metallo-hydrolase [Gemmatimonadota bacterium]|nr:MBL fold metallo-hydrolase [Gemmatimonadota bacterium]